MGPWLATLLIFQRVNVLGCPLCLGWGQPTLVEQLVGARQVVLAVMTPDNGRFRVTTVIKGSQPADPVVEGGFPRTGPGSGGLTSTFSGPLMLFHDDAFSTWVVLGAIDSSRADWLRGVVGGKPAAERSSAEWSARVALALPHLDDSEPFAAELAIAELSAAPYAVLRTLKSNVDTTTLRRWLADPELTPRHALCLILLGIGGNPKDAAMVEERLEVARKNGDATNLSSLLAADLELRGVDRMAWLDTTYLRDPQRSTMEVKAALLALSVHGHADGTIPRERVIQSYRIFIQAHPEIAGEVAPDLAAWKSWDAVPDYLALMKSKVRQQYPSRRAMLAYLRQSPNAVALGFSPEPVPGEGTAAVRNSSPP